MCCGVVSLCQCADELQVVCARRELTDCVIRPVSRTFMPFTHSSSPLFIVFHPAGTGSWTSRSLFKTLVEIRSGGVNFRPRSSSNLVSFLLLRGGGSSKGLLASKSVTL